MWMSCMPAAARRIKRTEEPSGASQIAEELFLSIDAVKMHLRTLFAKFELSELAQNEKRAPRRVRPSVRGDRTARSHLMREVANVR